MFAFLFSFLMIFSLSSCNNKIHPLPEITENEKENAYEQANTYLKEGFMSAAMFYYAVAADYKDAKDQYTALYGQLHSIASSDRFGLCVQPDGSVITIFDKVNNIDFSEYSDLIAVSPGFGSILGLTRTGNVIYMGVFSNPNYLKKWNDIMAISANDSNYYLGVTSNHMVVASMGYNKKLQKSVTKWRDIISVTASYGHAVGLRRDGTVVAAGFNDQKQCDVADWTDIVAIAVGEVHTIGLKSDGTVVATGNNDYGQCEVSDWVDIITVCADEDFTIGLKKDGSVLVAGDTYHIIDEVSNWTDIIAIWPTGLGINRDGAVLSIHNNYNILMDVSGWKINQHDLVNDETEFKLKEYLSNEYEYVGELIEGLILVGKDGYYGYVDEKGQLIIPLKYQDASDFNNGRAVVSPADKYGVIDKHGNYVLEPKYQSAEIIDDFMMIKGTISQYLKTDKYFLLYDLDGNEIVPNESNEILIGDNKRITAKVYDKENINLFNSIVYDYEGNIISSFKEGCWVGKFSNGYALFRDGGAKVAEDGLYKKYYGIYTYIDIDGNKVTDDYFVRATDFDNGIAIVLAGICHTDGSGAEDTSWQVIDNNFETLYELGPGDYDCLGVYHDYVKFKERGGWTNSYCLINMKTNTRHGIFSSITEVAEADAIIVQDADTGLYGLFAGGELVKDYEYNSISYAGDGVFQLEQGVSKTEYSVPTS